MKRKIGAALLAGLLMIGGTVAYAADTCVPGVLVDWDQGFAYETNYTPATFTSAVGSNLVMVGRLVALCGPLGAYEGDDPVNEYTIYFYGLTSNGTTKPTATRWVTTYNGGLFAIYEGTPKDAPPDNAMPANPPNGSVPSTFTNGTAILSGTLSNFRTQIVLLSGNYSSSLAGNYTVTGGTQAALFAGTGLGILTGTWCPTGSGGNLCSLPAGYSNVSNGKFDNPPTPALGSTWGAIKALYR
jgi:hypothetical protein